MSQKGDFIGFKFNGVHSSDLGIVRVSEGSRYNDNLLPNIEDKTVAVPGGDGMYYFGSWYRQKDFNISFAFDEVTEKQFRALRSHFGNKQMGELIFDETPYKAYQVKVTGTPSLEYICFDEEVKVDGAETTQRIYKGEGTVTFSAFLPFARSVHKTLGEFEDKYYPNKAEWADASGLPKIFDFEPQPSTAERQIEGEDGNKKTEEYTQGYKLYYCNPGDMEADFKIKISFVNGVINVESLQLYSVVDKLGTQNSTEKLSFSAPIVSKNDDDAILIDSKLNIIQGLKNEELTGNIYNEYISTGTFFKLPYYNPSFGLNTPYIDVSSFSNSDCPKPTLDFYYLYY